MTDETRNWGPFVLLLIDVQKDFWPEGIAQHFPHFSQNVAQLLTSCRSEGLEIVHLRASFKPDMSDWMAMYKLRGHIPCVEGTPGVETLPFACEEPGETVMIKHTFDGFQSTELLGYLRRKQKRFVLVAGLVTSVCVFLTSASAAQHGFLTAVVEDCCADQPDAHEHTLDHYDFIFDRTTVDLIPAHYPEWVEWLGELEEQETAENRNKSAP